MDKDEALKRALEALEAHADIGIKSDKAIAVCKQALAAQPAPVQEPVVMPENWFSGMPEEYRKEAWRVATPPAAPVPLTDEQIDAEFEVFASKFDHESNEWLDMGVDEYFRAGFRAAAPAAQPAVPDAITDDSESPEYRTGWNDCRQAMMEMMK
jgi:hypothetical protein